MKTEIEARILEIYSQKIIEKLNKLKEIVKKSFYDNVKSKNMWNKVLNNYKKKVNLEIWGDENDIVLGGGFISARSPYDISFSIM